MDALREIERRVEDGFVFDEQGRWVYMSELRVREKSVIDELGRGNVLVDGRWSPIGEAKRRARPSMPARSISSILPPQPRPAGPPTPKPAADAPEFEAQDNMLETICIDAALIRQIRAGGVDPAHGGVDKNSGGAIDFQNRDELNETTAFTMERVDTPAGAGPPQRSNGAANVNDGANNNDVSAGGDVNANAGGGTDSVLLFGLSKGAAAEQSKYAMEYIEELQISRKRGNVLSALAIASISLAAAAAVAIIVIQNLD